MPIVKLMMAAATLALVATAFAAPPDRIGSSTTTLGTPALGDPCETPLTNSGPYWLPGTPTGCGIQKDAFKADHCVGVYRRQYSARLWNISGSWEAACAVQPATIKGLAFARPTRCRNMGLLTGMWGEWDLPDPSCSPIQRPAGNLPWEAGVIACSKQAKQMCTRMQICPDGRTPAFPRPEGDVWMSVNDHANAWISVGTKYPERLCRLHEHLGGPPGWGMTTGPKAVTGQNTAFACCQ